MKKEVNFASSTGKLPEDPPRQTTRNITVGIKLEGYERIKAQLDSIESQIDIIIEKSSKLTDSDIKKY